ncbi:hypothetical protein M6B38_221500 [Iris pallida]|uniref:Uncharacterized protein n=1 Tax=Iris pallida TaxID=29817 RepID=A0AAX6DW18_IRIPA|nr:hypothetical protein M6B38_221500 [Iris pallida]
MSPPFGEYKLFSLILLDALRPRTAFYRRHCTVGWALLRSRALTLGCGSLHVFSGGPCRSRLKCSGIRTRVPLQPALGIGYIFEGTQSQLGPLERFLGRPWRILFNFDLKTLFFP